MTEQMDRIFLIQVAVNALTQEQYEELGTTVMDATAAYCNKVGVDWVGSSHSVTDASEDPDLQVQRLRAGEDQTSVPDGCWPTPGQWVARWNSMTADQRLDCATAVVTMLQYEHDRLMTPEDAPTGAVGHVWGSGADSTN